MDINNINFTDKVKEIITISDHKAKQKKNQYIDNAHVILSILDTKCLGKQLLESAKIDTDRLRKFCNDTISALPVITTQTSKVEITTDLLEVIKNAQTESSQLGDTYIASDLIVFHILSDTKFKKFTETLDTSIDTLRTIIHKYRENDKINSSSSEDKQQSLSEYLINITEQAEKGKLENSNHRGACTTNSK